MKGYQRIVWVDQLRTCITILVVLHHAAVSYSSFAPISKQRSEVFDVLIAFNDAFFMPLLFLLSGFFVYPGLLHKGAKKFLIDRCLRLGVPFLLFTALVTPVGSYTAVRAAGEISFWTFLRSYDWGPAHGWFLWVLLVFNVIAAIVFKRRQKGYEMAADRMLGLMDKPFTFLLTAMLLVMIALVPLSLTGISWVNAGPLAVETNRTLLYALFFFCGTCLGSRNWEAFLFRDNRLLGWKWGYWLLMCLIGFCIYLVTTVLAPLKAPMYIAYSISCVASSFLALASFKRWSNTPSQMWKNLTANAYGIYLFHLFFINWSDYVLLHCQWPIAIKFFIVFSISLSFSWLLTMLFRKVRTINRVL